ncbi:MAG: glycosyltransferase family 4 protein [Acidobacteria bacterium]|nr:glycosyltransferase family 4 protein [Acidobacteriota bacterium]
MKLHLGLDARAAMIDPYRGLGRVTAQLARVLIRRNDLEVTLFVPRHAHVPGPWYRGARAIVHLPQPSRGAFLWDGPAWRWILRRHRVDVLHLPAWGVPPGIPVPVVSTLHDITPLRIPGSIPSAWARRRACQRLETHRRASLVHAVSRATAADAVHGLGIVPDRVRVAGWGVDTRLFVPGPNAARRHVLFVGGADPHKRIGLLVDAWTAPGSADLPPLVIAGGAARAPFVRQAAAADPDRIELVGLVGDETLARLYRTAIALLMPSLWEGFGLPVLEAMASGCVPVLTGRASLPEVGGDAALYVPASAPPESWAQAVRRLTGDASLRDRLSARALTLAAARRWEATADALVGIYREAAAPTAS